MTNRLSALVFSIALGLGAAITGQVKPAEAATLGVFGNDFVREIRVVRLYGQRIATAPQPTIEAQSSAGVTASLTQFRGSSAADIDIDTGNVPAGQAAFGWVRFSGIWTFNNTTANVTSATILTDMLAQGRITNADPSKVNILQATVDLFQDGNSVFSANMGGAGVTWLNTRTGSGSPLGGVTTLFFAPNSVSVMEYAFSARVVVNGPVPAAVPLPASSLLMLLGIGAFAVARRSTPKA